MAGDSKDRAQEKLALIADGLVVALAMSLPWSTSATAILAVLWLLALLPTLRWADIRREIWTPAGGLPVYRRTWRFRNAVGGCHAARAVERLGLVPEAVGPGV